MTMVMPVVAVELGQQLHDLVAATRVEVAGRLVGEHHVGLGDDGAGDRHALLLAAGELARVVALPARQPDLGERIAAATRAPLRPAHAAVDERQLDVLQRRGARQQIEALEHEAE